MKRPKPKQHVSFPWEYDALAERERKSDNLKGRRRQKALSKAEAQRQRARRAKQVKLTDGVGETIRCWPQGWRVPTPAQPMSSKEYVLYLQTEHWQKFGREYRADPTALHQCFVCGELDYELHHRSYVRLGRELFVDVVPLCAAHHKAVHKAVKAGVKLAVAHVYVRIRYVRDELDMRKRSLTSEDIS